MIGFIQGTVEYIGEKSAILSAGGVGYTVTMAPKILATLSKNQDQVKVFIYSRMNPREGTFEYYGFTKPEDLELFRTLVSVSGMGPKSALQVLGTVEPRHLKEAVAAEDPKALRALSGLGAKTCQRLVVELAGKLDYIDATGSDLGALDMQAQALEALVSLGYTSAQAKEALAQIKDAVDLSDTVRKALQSLAR